MSKQKLSFHLALSRLKKFAKSKSNVFLLINQFFILDSHYNLAIKTTNAIEQTPSREQCDSVTSCQMLKRAKDSEKKQIIKLQIKWFY